MNVNQILERVKLEIDHDLTSDQVIGRMNSLELRLYRKFKFPEKIYGFFTVDIPYYELPPDCPEDRVRCVVIDGIEYTKVTPETQHPTPYFCTAFLNSLFVSCNSVGREAYLYYRPKPGALTSDLAAVPALPEDYHDLYIYDAAQWIAGIQRDVDMKNNFMSEYDVVYRDAYADLKKMGLKRVKETTRW